MTKSTIHCTHPLRRGLLSRRWSSATRKVEYLLKDRLGSVDAVANSTGTIIETRGYDEFDKPRDGSWNDLNPAKIASTAAPKGFTQHEHLNQFELIHMNGRAFDYHLGRFTGVDPFIQFPLNSQSLNPYSYILNDPLGGTDPTGYDLECSDKRKCSFQGSDIDQLEVHTDKKTSKVTAVVAVVDGARIKVESAQVSNGATTQALNFSRQDTLDKAASTIGAAVSRGTDLQAEYNGQNLRARVDMGDEAKKVFGGFAAASAVGTFCMFKPDVCTWIGVVKTTTSHAEPADLLWLLGGRLGTLKGEASATASAAIGATTEEMAQGMRGAGAGRGVEQAMAEKAAWSPAEAASGKVPSSWGDGVPTKKGEGMRWADPSNRGNGVRIDRGNPNNSQATQRVDHVIVRQNGQVIGGNGKPISGSIADNAVEAHIPLNEWRQWSSWSSP